MKLLWSTTLFRQVLWVTNTAMQAVHQTSLKTWDLISPGDQARPDPWRSVWSTWPAGLVCKGLVGGRAPRISPSLCLWEGWSWSCTWPVRPVTCGRCEWTCPRLENRSQDSRVPERGLDSRKLLCLLYPLPSAAENSGIAVVVVWKPLWAFSPFFWSGWCRLWWGCGVYLRILSCDRKNVRSHGFWFTVCNYYSCNAIFFVCLICIELKTFPEKDSLPKTCINYNFFLLLNTKVNISEEWWSSLQWHVCRLRNSLYIAIGFPQKTETHTTLDGE